MLLRGTTRIHRHGPKQCGYRPYTHVIDHHHGSPAVRFHTYELGEARLRNKALGNQQIENSP